MQPTPNIWTIGGSDTSGGAGMQVDLRTMQSLGLHGRSVVTAITSQNRSGVADVHAATPEQVVSQLQALKADYLPAVIKVGMLATEEIVEVMARELEDCEGLVVVDPVLVSSSGAALLEEQAVQTFIEKLLPQVDILTPNLAEAEKLTGVQITDPASAENAVDRLLELGAKAVYLKGGHAEGTQAQDFFTDGEQSFWLNAPRLDCGEVHGTGCVFSSALASFIAHGQELKDALVLAKAYIQQSLRHADQGETGLQGWPCDPVDLPTVTPDAASGLETWAFAAMPEEAIGLYPIVDEVSWLERLLPLGIRTVQLRIKDRNHPDLEAQVVKAIELGREYLARVFINDHWELAVKHQAFGIHIGQDDLPEVDLRAVEQAGLRLGVSTHSFYEAARAMAYNPSYIASGTLFQTTSKVMDYEPLGMEQLKRIRAMISKPLVAIGGIHRENAPEVIAAGADGCAVISEVTQAVDLEGVVTAWRGLWER